MTERIQKILSQWGIASRREAERMIRDQRVKLNGKVAQLGDKADPNIDRLEVDGKRVKIKAKPDYIYLLLHKPRGVISSCSDPENRQTVIDLLPEELQKGKGIHPVGRLDRDSTGALILTNDGELTINLTHPRYHISKTYQVWVRGNVSDSVLKTWRTGVNLDGIQTAPAEVRLVRKEGEETLLEIVITEGRNRQIRRTALELGLDVTKLHRSAIGQIKLQQPNQDRLKAGDYRPLTEFELKYLKRREKEKANTQ